MEEQERERFLEAVINLARKMLECGAEVHRAEDMIRIICTSYGFEKCEVYSTTSQILVTVRAADGKHYTQSGVIHHTSNDLGMLEKINSKSRKVCKELPDVSKIELFLEACERRKRPNRFIESLGYVVSAGAFSIFFGGTLRDGIAAAIIAIAVFAMDKLLRMKRMSRVIYTIFACFVTGCFSQLAVYSGFAQNSDKVMIGLIMLFIPTLATVNSVRELFRRDIMTGMFRLVEAVMTTVAIALGFAAAVRIMGGVAL